MARIERELANGRRSWTGPVAFAGGLAAATLLIAALQWNRPERRAETVSGPAVSAAALGALPTMASFRRLVGESPEVLDTHLTRLGGMASVSVPTAFLASRGFETNGHEP
jgi:hypothetical protein